MQGGRVGRVGGQRRGQVDGQGRGADAAAGAEHRDRSTTRRSAGPVVPPDGRCRSPPCSPSARRRAASMSSSADRVGQEVLRPLLERLQERLVVVADGQDRQLRVLDRELADHLQRLVACRASRATIARSGSDWLDDVEEVLVAGALGLEPHEVHAQQQRAEGLAGRFGRVYDRDALHDHHRVSCLVVAASAAWTSRPRGDPGPALIRHTQLPRNLGHHDHRRGTGRGSELVSPASPEPAPAPRGRTADAGAPEPSAARSGSAGTVDARGRHRGGAPATPLAAQPRRRSGARCRRSPTHGKIAAVGSHLHAAL